MLLLFWAERVDNQQVEDDAPLLKYLIRETIHDKNTVTLYQPSGGWAYVLIIQFS